MTETDKTAGSVGKLEIIQSVKSPLGFFVLVILIGEAVLLTLAAKADGIDRTIGIVGMIFLVFASGVAVYFMATRHHNVLNALPEGLNTQETIGFDRMAGELSLTLGRLESNGFRLARVYKDQGDGQRLLDGLYSGILFAAGAVPTGRIEPLFYGNLMEWNKSKKSLQVRYFKGPYNDEIICRIFPLEGPKQGVASEAVLSRKIQFRNEMGDELKERGESLLKAMMSVPVSADSPESLQEGEIVVINIDSVQENVFPVSIKAEFSALESRAMLLAALTARVNKMRSEIGVGLT